MGRIKREKEEEERRGIEEKGKKEEMKNTPQIFPYFIGIRVRNHSWLPRGMCSFLPELPGSCANPTFDSVNTNIGFVLMTKMNESLFHLMTDYTVHVSDST